MAENVVVRAAHSCAQLKRTLGDHYFFAGDVPDMK